MDKTKIIIIAVTLSLAGIAGAVFVSAQATSVVRVDVVSDLLVVQDATAHEGSFVAFAETMNPEPTSEPTAEPTVEPTPDPAVLSAYEQRCGPSIRLTEGNIINVSTHAQAQSAINGAQPGDVIRLAAGTYTGRLEINNKNGTADRPIVIEAAEGAYRQAIIENSANTGISSTNSSYIHIRNLQIRNVRFGMLHSGLENSEIDGNHIHDTIWKAIQVSAVASGRTRTGRPSSNVTIACNHIHDTGRTDNWTNAHNGEGIYIGSGFIGDDRTNNVTVIYNEIHDTTGEAIELKHLVRDSSVLYNKIYNITIHDLGNAGAIAAQHQRVGTGGFKEVSGDPKILIKGNRVWNVRRSAQAIASAGGTEAWRWSAANAVRTGGAITVTENIFWDIQDAAVKIQDLDGRTDVYNKAVISDNIIHNASFNSLNNTGAIRDQSGVISLTTSGNIADKPASFFTGPVDGDANDGKGLVPANSPPSFIDQDYFW